MEITCKLPDYKSNIEGECYGDLPYSQSSLYYSINLRVKSVSVSCFAAIIYHFSIYKTSNIQFIHLPWIIYTISGDNLYTCSL